MSDDNNKIISGADRTKAVATIYSLLVRKEQLVTEGKNLANLQGILYIELAFALKKSYDDDVEVLIKQQHKKAKHSTPSYITPELLLLRFLFLALVAC